MTQFQIKIIIFNSFYTPFSEKPLIGLFCVGKCYNLRKMKNCTEVTMGLTVRSRIMIGNVIHHSLSIYSHFRFYQPVISGLKGLNYRSIRYTNVQNNIKTIKLVLPLIESLRTFQGNLFGYRPPFCSIHTLGAQNAEHTSHYRWQ